MKTRHIISLAVLTIMMGACSSEDNSQQPAADCPKKVPFVATIQAEAATRGLTEAENGQSISAKWEKDEKLALITASSISMATVTSVDDNGNATIKGEILSAEDGKDLHVVYAGTKFGIDYLMINMDKVLDNHPGYTSITKEFIDEAMAMQLSQQDGTLDYINRLIDYRYAKTTIAMKGTYATFGSAVAPASQFAIWKVSLQDESDKAFCAKPLGITDGDGKALLTITPATDDVSKFYIALPPTESATFTFKATAFHDYSCTKTGVSLKAGNLYRSTLKMLPLTTSGTITFSKATDTKTWSATATDNTYQQQATVDGDAVPTYSISDNTCGATIDASTGVVTFTKAGSVTVTATVADTKDYVYATKTATYTLTVAKAAGSISYPSTMTSIEKIIGDAAFTNTLTHTGDGTVEYTSSDTKVATVNKSTGEVTIVGVGTTTITATVTDGTNYTYATKTATYTLKVLASGGIEDYNVNSPDTW